MVAQKMQTKRKRSSASTEITLQRDREAGTRHRKRTKKKCGELKTDEIRGINTLLFTRCRHMTVWHIAVLDADELQEMMADVGLSIKFVKQ